MKRRRDSGVALVLALLVLVILVVLIGQMTITGLHHRTAAGNRVADLQNAYGTRSGYHQALLYLKADGETRPEVDSLQERWALPFDLELGRADVRVQVVDTSRFLNLSALTDEKGDPVPAAAARLRRLVRALRHPPETADRILDYVDADARGEFEMGARNRRLESLDELLRIEGLDPVLVHGGEYRGQEVGGLRSFLTLWPREGEESGLVNLNTAPSEVLQSLADEMAPAFAEAIVTYRTGNGADGRVQAFEKAEDVKRVAGISDTLFQALSGQVAVKAAAFEIRARSRVGNVEKTWSYVVSRSGGTAPGVETPPGSAPQAATLKLLDARPLHDFLGTPPPPAEPE